MNREEHIIALMKESTSDAEAKEKIKEFLKSDYVPKKSVGYEGIEDLEKPLPALPGMRCTRITGNDIQSGPFCCGKPGYIYGRSKKGYYIMCKNCANHHGIKLNEKT